MVATTVSTSDRELATHAVLNAAIAFAVIPIWLALTHQPRRYGHALQLVATVTASVMHWNNVIYGSWRHFLDIAVAGTTVITNMFTLARFGSAARVRAACTLLAGAAGSYAISWKHHAQNRLEAAMCFHLLFRYCAFWPIALAQLGSRSFTSLQYCTGALALSAVYSAFSAGLFWWATGRRPRPSDLLT